MIRFSRSLPGIPALLAVLALLGAPAVSRAGDAAAVAPVPAKAEVPDRVLQPLLWRVSGKDLKAPSYLFGTIHLSDERIIRMHPLSRAAFRKCASLHTEIAMDPKGEQAMAKAVLRHDGRKLDAEIGPELSGKLTEELKRINPALGAAVFQPFKTWAVAVSLPTLEDQLKGGEPLDVQLWKKAEAAGKRCGALETMEEHMGGLDTLTAKEQVLLLKASLEAMAKERAGTGLVDKNKLVALYLSGDAKGIADLEKEEKDDPDATPEEKALEGKMEKLLMADRNPVMAAVMLKELKAHPQESHFFAAGTAHFVGEGNVGALLEKEGYVVERLKAAAPGK